MNALAPPTRRRLAIALAALGLAALAASFLVLYLHANLWDEEGFSTNAAEALRDEAVSAYVSERLVEQIVEQGREDLIAAQPVIAGVMPTVVRSPLFRPVFQRAAAHVHRTLFDPDTADQGLVLDLTDIGIVLSGFLQNRRPELASDIPQQIRAAVVRVTGEGPGKALVLGAQVSSWLVFVLPILTVGLLAGAIAAVRDRRRLLTAIGLGAAGVALVMWIASMVTRSVVRGEVVPANRGAAQGVLDAYLGSIPAWCLILAGAGALVAATAATSLGAEELNARVMTGVRAVFWTPGGEWARTLRAVLLVAVGAGVILEPDTSVRVAAVAFGFYIVLLGLTELVRQAERFSTRDERVRPSRRRLAAIATAGALLALAGLTAGLVAAFTGGAGTRVAAETGMRCNGYEVLCGRTIPEVVFPATHNSMSAAAAGFVNANQSQGIVDQLDSGIRGLLIDVYNGAPGNFGRIATEYSEETRATAIREVGEAGVEAIERLVGRLDASDRPTAAALRPYLCHVVCELGATDALELFTRLGTWLVDHPREVLVVFVQDEGVTPAQMEDLFAASGLADLVFTYDPTRPWPTLRELIDANQRLFVLAEHEAAPGTWYHQGFDLFQETPYDEKTVAALASDTSCRPNRGPAGAPLFLLNSWVATYPPKPSNARIANEYDFLLARARRCEELRGHLPNLIAVDFASRGDVVGVAAALNGVGRAAAG